MKRPVNMTIEVDDSKPQGWALQFGDGSLSDTYFYRIDDLDYSCQQAEEKQARNLMLRKKFKERYSLNYDSTCQLHRDGYGKIEDEMEHLRMVPVWLFTTKTRD